MDPSNLFEISPSSGIAQVLALRSGEMLFTVYISDPVRCRNVGNVV